jgi:hypothetical protein
MNTKYPLLNHIYLTHGIPFTVEESDRYGCDFLCGDNSDDLTILLSFEKSIGSLFPDRIGKIWICKELALLEANELRVNIALGLIEVRIDRLHILLNLINSKE